MKKVFNEENKDIAMIFFILFVSFSLVIHNVSFLPEMEKGTPKIALTIVSILLPLITIYLVRYYQDKNINRCKEKRVKEEKKNE